MFCYAVWLKSPNIQARVYSYECNSTEGRLRAEKLAIDLAKRNAQNGHHCTVERFGGVDVGIMIFDTEKD